MKSWIILIVLAVVLTAAATMALPFLSTESLTKGDSTYPAPAKPIGPASVAEVAENLVYNFGSLPQEYNGHHTWTFKNTGAGPLELRGASKTCSCTSAALFGEHDEKKLTVQPGETLPIEVTFHTKRFDGNWGQNVTVGTNDPEHPTVVLRVEGVVKPAISTYPADPSMSYGTVSNEEPILRKVALYSNDQPDIKILKVTSSNPELLEVATHPLTEGEAASLSTDKLKVEKGHAVEVTLKPTSHLGAFAEEVLVETSHTVKPDLRFKVAGRVTGIISSLPEKVTVRGATAKGGGAETLKLMARGRDSVKFSVQSKPEGLDVSIEPIPPAAGVKGSMYKMSVKVIPGAVTGRIVDEIVLKTDEPKASELKIPVDVIVQGSK